MYMQKQSKEFRQFVGRMREIRDPRTTPERHDALQTQLRVLSKALGCFSKVEELLFREERKWTGLHFREIAKRLQIPVCCIGHTTNAAESVNRVTRDKIRCVNRIDNWVTEIMEEFHSQRCSMAEALQASADSFERAILPSEIDLRDGADTDFLATLIDDEMTMHARLDVLIARIPMSDQATRNLQRLFLRPTGLEQLDCRTAALMYDRSTSVSIATSLHERVSDAVKPVPPKLVTASSSQDEPVVGSFPRHDLKKRKVQ